MVDGYEARIANHAMRCGGCGNGVDTGDEYGAAEIIVAIAVLCMDCIEFFDDEEDEKGTETTYLIAEVLNTGDWGILGSLSPPMTMLPTPTPKNTTAISTGMCYISRPKSVSTVSIRHKL